MSDDLVNRLMAIPTYDDIEEAVSLIHSHQDRIKALDAVIDDVMGYLSRLLQSLRPTIELLPTLLGVCTQIDNVLAGQKEEIARLRAALATARNDALEEVAIKLEPKRPHHLRYDQVYMLRRIVSDIRAMKDREP